MDVYRLSIGYVAWVYKKAHDLGGIHRHARDQWLRAGQSIPLNIAEGNGKSTVPDRRRYFEIALGSALECAAIQDVLVVGEDLDKKESRERKIELIASPQCSVAWMEEVIAAKKTPTLIE